MRAPVLSKIVGLLLITSAMLSAQLRLVEGNSRSPVHVIIYEDLQCPDCAAFNVMLEKELLPRYRTEVAFEHRDFPLAKHSWARKAAIASRYFEFLAQAAALEFRRNIMADQAKITPENFDEYFMAFVNGHRIDPAQAKAAMNDPGLAAQVEKDYQEGVARGVARTPTVFVDDETFVENFPAADIIKSIDHKLAAHKP